MSKEKYTYCEVATNSIVIRKNGSIALNIDTNDDLKTIHFDYARDVVKCLNNHDRLVEALEVSNKALQKITLLTRRDEASLTDLKEAMDQYREIKQLLTELKS